MKRFLSIIVSLIIVVSALSSCKQAHSELYGAWYFDENGQRDAIQFSVNDSGKDSFIWAKYDIVNDSVTSISKGYFNVSGDNITLDYVTSDIDLTLKYTIDGDKLTLSSETGFITLTKKVLD